MRKCLVLFFLSTFLFCAGPDRLTGTIVETDTGCIEGRVRYADGKSAALVSVILHDQQDSAKMTLGKRQKTSRSKITSTDLDGFYKFDSISKGLYFIESKDHDTLGALSRATISECDTLVSNLVLDRCGAITGKIDTNNLSPKLKVAIFLPEVDRFVRIDSTGIFTIANLPAGDFQLHVKSIDSISRFATDSIKVSVSKGTTTNLTNFGSKIFQEVSFELSKDSNTIALWNFNQIKDSIIPDESGNNNIGKAFGTTKLIIADWGTGVELSEGCGIKVNDAASLQLSNFEIIVKVFPMQFTKRNTVITKEPRGGGFPGGYFIMFDDYGYISGSARDASGWIIVKTLSRVQLNNWYTIKLRKTSDTVSLFVNDLLISSKPISVDPSSEIGNMGIGYDVNEVEDRYFRGYIDAIRIDNLKGDAVRTGLIASWSFDSYADSTFYDVTGHSFDLVSYDLTLPLVPGIWSRALSCPGDGIDLEVNNSHKCFSFNAFSIESWVYLTSDSSISNSTECVISQQHLENGIGNAWGIFINNSRKANFGVADSIGSSYYEALSMDQLKPHEWYFLVATFDSKTLKLYVNGALNGSTAYNGGYVPQRTIDACIACQVLPDTTLGGFFNGKLDELKLYNCSLSADTIQTHYNALKPK